MYLRRRSLRLRDVLLKDERTDVVLLKFLWARESKVKNAFVMLRDTIH